jgi:hypothetical protein
MAQGQALRVDQLDLTQPIRANQRVHLERAPFRLMIAYLLSTIAIFVFGPVDWPIENWTTLIVFLSAVLGALWLGFRLGVQGAAATTELRHWKRLVVIGSIATVVLMFPAAFIYTGKMPWQIFEALQDQSEAYLELQRNLNLTTLDDRAALAVIRAAVAPLALATIPLGIIHWRKLSSVLRVLVGAAILSNIVLSILRGTDREIADLVIVGFSAFLIVVARSLIGRKATLLSELKRRRLLIFLAVAVFAIAAALFVDRKEQRVGDVDQVCVGDTPICANYDRPLSDQLDDRAKFALSMSALYFGQGYYGLSLALAKDFQTTWGLGHSLALMSYYSAFKGNEDLYERSYTFRLRDDGWSDLGQWSTMFPWIANDVGFPGVPFVVGLLGWIWGKSWKDAVFGKNEPAAIVFVFMMLMVFYMPANNQLTQTIDVYFAVVVWMLVWLRGRWRAGH